MGGGDLHRREHDVEKILKKEVRRSYFTSTGGTALAEWEAVSDPKYRRWRHTWYFTSADPEISRERFIRRWQDM
ncbi:hypothetical protein GCM10009069_29070 [Algimonas arctica]|uniref:Uncharacterized protein n=1 Tax=Algimonas arctica TaxID=1479486 RepID=A0A8J3G3Q3_9PROT|nr:hypothetical protein GCM10009069_29070 [Algimonas arctica]